MIEPVLYPRAQLDLYDEAVILTRYAGRDCRTSYPVAVDDLIAAFSHVPVSSGLLPAGCLFWGRENGQTRVALYVPGRRWRLQMAERTFHIPLPPLVFLGAGVQYRVYAVKQRPRAMPLELYHCPTPNVHPNGVICPGNIPFPACASDTIEQALSLFLEGSLFNGDLAAGKCVSDPEDVRQLWAQLEGATRFPNVELVKARTEWAFTL
jgi:hypothetical protein